jgi:hypothetical protein
MLHLKCEQKLKQKQRWQYREQVAFDTDFGQSAFAADRTRLAAEADERLGLHCN